jgi:hypothetical protein
MDERKPRGWKFKAFAIVSGTIICIGMSFIGWKFWESPHQVMEEFNLEKADKNILCKASFINESKTFLNIFNTLATYENNNRIIYFITKKNETNTDSISIDILFDKNGIVRISYIKKRFDIEKIWSISPGGKYLNIKFYNSNTSKFDEVNKKLLLDILFKINNSKLNLERTFILNDEIDWKRIPLDEEALQIFSILEKFQPNWKTHRSWWWNISERDKKILYQKKSPSELTNHSQSCILEIESLVAQVERALGEP